MLKLVDAKTDDLIQINELMFRSKAYWGYDPHFMNKFMKLFQITSSYLEKNTVKLLFKNNSDNSSLKIIGFYSFAQDTKGDIELDNFFIDPDFIGKGFGKKMWHYLLEDLRELNQQEFILWSDPSAENFYKKMGCQKIGTKKSPMMPNRYPVIFKCLV